MPDTPQKRRLPDLSMELTLALARRALRAENCAQLSVAALLREPLRQRFNSSLAKYLERFDLVA